MAELLALLAVNHEEEEDVLGELELPALLVADQEE